MEAPMMWATFQSQVLPGLVDAGQTILKTTHSARTDEVAPLSGFGGRGNLAISPRLCLGRLGLIWIADVGSDRRMRSLVGFRDFW